MDGYLHYPADKSCDIIRPIRELYFQKLARFGRTQKMKLIHKLSTLLIYPLLITKMPRYN